MNWYKKSQIEQTLEYFQELSDYGDYVPDAETVSNELNQRTKSEISYSIGCGSNGCAYRLTNGDIFKITTNNIEGTIAEWLMQNPHANIVSYKDTWKKGDLWYIVMEFVQPDTNLSDLIFKLETILDNNKCYNPGCAIDILKNENFPFKDKIISYLKHISGMPGINPFDFLNHENIGISNGELKFFDIN